MKGFALVARRPRRWLVALCVVASVGSGCAGDGPAATTGGGTFETMQETIFQTTCLDGGCHNLTDQAGGLVLERGFSYAQLRDVTPVNLAARDAGLRRVVANDVDASFLMLKVLDPPSQFGTRMPQGKPPLSTADVDLIRAWIEEGAPGPVQPEFTPTTTASATVTATVTETPTITATATATASVTHTAIPTISPTGTLPASPTASITATRTPTATTTPTPSATSKPTILAGSTFSEIQQNIFNPSCLNEGCHNLTDQAGGLILDAAFAYDALVGVTPQSPNAVARGLLRVEAGDPSGSFLFTKITLRTAFDITFGARMPQATPALPSQQIEQIRAWILRGALREEP